MLRIAVYSALVLYLLSCKSFRSIEGRTKPVYFSADGETYKDSSYPVLTISYPVLQDLKGGIVESLEIRSGESNKALISRPTLFNFYGSPLIVYPGERIGIRGSVEGPVFTTKNGDNQRDRELNFLNTYYKLQKYPNVPTYIIEPSIDTVLQLEASQKNRIAEANLAARKLFDSLAHAAGVSSKFRDLAWGYVADRNEGSLLWLFSIYRDTLKAHNLYYQKLRAQVPRFNAIAKASTLDYSTKYNLNELARELFPHNHMWSMGNEEDFKRCFDSVANNFTGVARAYLLSRIMLRANMLGIHVAPEYKKLYRRSNSNRDYKRIVQNAGKEFSRKQKEKTVTPNIMIAAGNNKQSSLEEIMAKHKGKLIYIDLWASWCSPCIKEIPHLNQLADKYSQEDIVFISISSDKQTTSWRDAIQKFKLRGEHNYLMLNAATAALYKNHDVSSIPRYLIIGKDGKMLGTDAPAPSDPALKMLLNKLLKEQ